MEEIYLDYAATTPLDPRVAEKMFPYFSEVFGNPNSPHGWGRRAVSAVDDARDQIASLLGAASKEIYFTSGGTESDNWAIRGAAHALAKKGKHVVVGATEHHAVLAAAQSLEKEGFSVSLAETDDYGTVTEDRLAAAMRKDTVLVGVMTANNEVGTLQPLSQLSKTARDSGALFFTDAVQAAGILPLNVNDPAVDLLSLSSHKFYGPKGVGVLYVRSGVGIDGLIVGGRQERGLRGGTLNVPAIVGMAEALRLAYEEITTRRAHLTSLRDRFIGKVLQEIPGALLNGHPKDRLPGNANFIFEGILGEELLIALDLAGVAASGGAACSSGSLEPSHVLLAMGRTEAQARGGVRFSFGKDTTAEQADRAVQILKSCVERLRLSR